MKNNTVTAHNGVEVYTSNIQAYADEFLEHELDEERREDIYNNSNTFMAMILYIADNIDKPDNNDIELLDNIFNIYIRLCVKYNMLIRMIKHCFERLSCWRILHMPGEIWLIR